MSPNWKSGRSLFLVMFLVIQGSSLEEKEEIPSWQPSQEPHSPSPDTQAESTIFIRKLFEKYGGNGVMTFEGFEHLMENIGLGNVEISDHDVHDHQTQTGFREFHEDHEHNRTIDQANHLVPASVEEPEEEPRTTKHPTEEDSGKSRNKKMKKTKKKKKKDRLSNSTELIGTRAKRWSVVYVEQKCATPIEILKTFRIQYNDGISPKEFVDLCPAIIYQLDQHVCQSQQSQPCHSSDHLGGSRAHCINFHNHTNDTLDWRQDTHQTGTDAWKVWLFASLAVTVISLVGLAGVAVIPIMDRFFYNHLLQFLIALAVGTLTGDALMHLLPHAMAPHDHSAGAGAEGCVGPPGESGAHDEGKDKGPVWVGLVGLVGIFFFFAMERILTIWSAQKKKKRNPGQKRKTGEVDPVGQKLCETSTTQTTPTTATTTTAGDYVLVLQDNTDDITIKNQKIYRGSGQFHSTSTSPNHPTTVDDDDNDDDDDDAQKSVDSHSQGHGHSHGQGQGHGHSHDVPKSVSAAAWMVIMGDGLHNFTDGLAIGASFANSLAVGLSTTVAVFCHELPHELGDFAVLLKAGMTIRQALVYNIVSSVLCFIGMTIGVSVGKTESATTWIFAVTAGIFLYIALVDMMPQLSSASSGLRSLVLNSLGVVCGLTVMLLIALYEDRIQLVVEDT